MSQPTSREALYERIRKSSKDSVIIEEMVRLGFWPEQGQIPNDPADEVRRRTELEKNLRALQTEAHRIDNEEQLLRALRKRRMEESRRKQQETKRAREQARQERAEAWRISKTRDIVYLGEKVSGGLSARDSNWERLRTQNLPGYTSIADLAEAMGLSLGALRFLAYSRSTSRVSHYKRFLIPKKTGGTRLISAPMPKLKQAQSWVLTSILDRVPVHSAAHGFLKGRSIVSNAQPHVGAELVINLDLKDFFPTLTYGRVKGLFRQLGYSESIATVLGLVCTEPDAEEVLLDGKRYFVSVGERHLPQGSPASPAITNLICRRLDRRLSALASKLGFTYTRYADDLTFSASGKERQVCNLLKAVASIVAHEGFVLHPDKTRVMRKGSRKEVTGIVVNEKLSVSREELRRFRATLFQIERDGLEGKRWGQGPDLLASITGFANFVAMVDPKKGTPLLEQVQRIRTKLGRPARMRPPGPKPAVVPPRQAPQAQAQAAEPAPVSFEQVPISSEADVKRGPEQVMGSVAEAIKKKPWWKFW